MAMNRTLRDGLLFLAACCVAAFATVALPLINYWVKHEPDEAKKPRIVAQVAVKQFQAPPPQQKVERKIKQPERAKPLQTQVKAGPRFAMDLSVGGIGGVAVAPNLINRPSGGGGGTGNAEDQGVDERPSPSFPPPFRLPDAIRDKEVDARVVLTFCVDASGRPYDLRILEEEPAGAGLAAAARQAVQQTQFAAAKKKGLPVAFCGLEQPFEVRFSR
jgi:protein TonB